MQRRDFMAMAGSLALAACASRVGGLAGHAAEAPRDAAAYRAQRRMVKTRFGRIACIDHGRGAAALFLHGFPLNSFQWRGAIARLSPYRRCVAPDLLGLGYTEVAPGQGVAPGAQVDMLAELLDTLGIATVDVGRERQRWRRRAIVPGTPSAPRAHAAVDQLRHGARLPAAGIAAGAGTRTPGDNSSRNGWRPGWRTRRWRVRRKASAG
jgi:hypothetical protein